MEEYECPVHGRFERIVDRPVPDIVPCECGELAEWRIAAPMVRKLTIKVQAVSTGKSDERPPGMLDTRPLFEGQSQADWNKARDKEDQEWRRKWVKEKFG